MKKFKKDIDVLKKFLIISPTKSILRIYKSLTRPNFDYKDVIYSQISNEYFSKKVKSYQYNASLTIISAIRIKSYDESVIEFLKI